MRSPLSTLLFPPRSLENSHGTQARSTQISRKLKSHVPFLSGRHKLHEKWNHLTSGWRWWMYCGLCGWCVYVGMAVSGWWRWNPAGSEWVVPPRSLENSNPMCLFCLKAFCLTRFLYKPNTIQTDTGYYYIPNTQHKITDQEIWRDLAIVLKILDSAFHPDL